MKTKIDKIISLLLITSYVALFVANVTHYHHINLASVLYQNVFEPQINQKAFSHSFFECTIHSTFNNLHNLTDLFFSNSWSYFFKSESLITSYQHFHLSGKKLNSNQLRAPPKLLL